MPPKKPLKKTPAKKVRKRSSPPRGTAEPKAAERMLDKSTKHRALDAMHAGAAFLDKMAGREMRKARAKEPVVNTKAAAETLMAHHTQLTDMISSAINAQVAELTKPHEEASREELIRRVKSLEHAEKVLVDALTPLKKARAEADLQDRVYARVSKAIRAAWPALLPPGLAPELLTILVTGEAGPHHQTVTRLHVESEGAVSEQSVVFGSDSLGARRGEFAEPADLCGERLRCYLLDAFEAHESDKTFLDEVRTHLLSTRFMFIQSAEEVVTAVLPVLEAAETQNSAQEELRLAEHRDAVERATAALGVARAEVFRADSALAAACGASSRAYCEGSSKKLTACREAERAARVTLQTAHEELNAAKAAKTAADAAYAAAQSQAPCDDAPPAPPVTSEDPLEIAEARLRVAEDELQSAQAAMRRAATAKEDAHAVLDSVRAAKVQSAGTPATPRTGNHGVPLAV